MMRFDSGTCWNRRWKPWSLPDPITDPTWIIDRLLLLGLLKLIEILGEAAARIRPETRNRYPQIPWMDIIDMRNRVVHVYFDIDRDEVWDTVTKDLPPLIEQLEKILENEPKTAD